MDRTLHAWAVAHRPPAVVALAETAAASATGPLPYAAALAAGWAACRTVTWTGRREALTVLGAVAVLAFGQLARWTTMRIVARPRPPLADWAAGTTGLAYPSGHATTAALTAGLLIWAACRTTAPRPVLHAAAVLCAGWAVAVGAARVVLGVHWPTDVLGGWLFASTWLALTLPPLTRLADRASAH
jgi:undecaprenyl-diphosphatase